MSAEEDYAVSATVEELSRGIREFARKLAALLNVRIEKILDALDLARLAEILDIRIVNGEIIGLRVKIPSETRRGVFYYTIVGIYGSKCTCEASMIRRRICKHIIATLIIWNILNLFRTGRQLDLSKLRWLTESEHGETTSSSGELREDSRELQEVS